MIENTLSLEEAREQILAFPGKFEEIEAYHENGEAFLTYFQHKDPETFFKMFLSDAFDNGATDKAVDGALAYINQLGYERFHNAVKLFTVLKKSGKAKIRIEETGDISVTLAE